MAKQKKQVHRVEMNEGKKYVLDKYRKAFTTDLKNVLGS